MYVRLLELHNSARRYADQVIDRFSIAPRGQKSLLTDTCRKAVTLMTRTDRLTDAYLKFFLKTIANCQIVMETLTMSTKIQMTGQILLKLRKRAKFRKRTSSRRIYASQSRCSTSCGNYREDQTFSVEVSPDTMPLDREQQEKWRSLRRLQERWLRGWLSYVID